jgi:hypothetical protein
VINTNKILKWKANLVKKKKIDTYILPSLFFLFYLLSIIIRLILIAKYIGISFL